MSISLKNLEDRVKVLENRRFVLLGSISGKNHTTTIPNILSYDMLLIQYGYNGDLSESRTDITELEKSFLLDVKNIQFKSGPMYNDEFITGNYFLIKHIGASNENEVGYVNSVRRTYVVFDDLGHVRKVYVDSSIPDLIGSNYYVVQIFGLKL